MDENSDDKPDSLQVALRALEVMFTAKLPSKLLEIEEALNRFIQNTRDEEALTLLYRLLHTMAGSAGTFGFAEMGLQARAFEARLKPLLAGGVWNDIELSLFSNDVRSYLSASLISATSVSITQQVDSNNSKPADLISTKLIYLVDDDPVANREITQQLEHFAYEVVVISELQKLADALVARVPDVVVIDLGSPEVRFAGAVEITRMKQSGQLKSPVIFISNSSGFESRLRVVRAGGDGYFTKPIDIVGLSERVDALIARSQPKGYRILIVDDDIDTSKYYGTVLRDAGMSAHVLNAPEEILNAMANFRPELILMDVYMPLCNGVELSKMIRLDNSYLDVPIVFLSSENDLEKQLEAVEAGADDFLTKPIVPKFLISALSSRAERYRSLRALIMRDGLTGLYNHTAIKEELTAEISIAGRNNSPLALAMIDLDNFKRVNDTYGHPVGDQVLRTLSLLLKQRLRRSDVIGRYGGEEFVVIFPGTTANVARKVLDQVRQAFFKIQQFSEQGEFSVSFSAGIAELTQTQDTDELFDSADAALYSAKHSGKNCIVLSGS
ncbi:MAG: diguanylate cyclase [Undibacterium sp.]|nr:diguanylate cyclase [Undibacterium sp.]